MSLVEQEKQSNDLYINPLFDGTQKWCWSADKKQMKDEISSKSTVWGVHFPEGFVYWRNINLSHYYVRAVRSDN
jgi:hypothetical protein